MQITLNENQTKEISDISHLDINGKKVYYKEIVHPLDFVGLHEEEKPIFEFSSKVTVDTKRPFTTFKAKDRKFTNVDLNDVVVIQVCKGNQEAEFITQVYKWGKICIPKHIIDILDINNHDNVDIKIIAKATNLAKTSEEIDLAGITNYCRNVKIIPRAGNFITVCYKQKIPVTLPRFIKLTTKLVELLFLIYGDGHYKSKLFFVNKYHELHKFVMDEFENIFRLPKGCWRARILIYDLKNSEIAKSYWGTILSLKNSQFYSVSKSTLKTNDIGNLRIIVDKTLFSLIFRFVLEKILKSMDKYTAFHALNGILCAEGGAQVSKIGLHKITLSFSQQEKGLFKEILSKAEILNLFKEEQNSRFVIQGWDKLYLFFKILLFNGVIPFRFHTERRNNAVKGFLEHSFTKTMIKYLSSINENNHSTVRELSNKLKIRQDSILDALRKEQYKKFVKIEGKNGNKRPFIISITEEGKKFLELVMYIEKIK